MAIKLGNPNAMCNLGTYYYYKSNYTLMQKFYNMADLAYYYETTEINYKLMTKYYIMAIILNFNISIENYMRYMKI